MKALETSSVLHTLQVLSNQDKIGIKGVTVSQKLLQQIEDHVIENKHLFLASDISIVILSLLKLDYFPNQVLKVLNMMSSLQTFKKDQAIRIFDVLVKEGKIDL